jgi:predicted enzyme related to lactoylglutathione lyase
MFKDTKPFFSYSVKDLVAARPFYAETLGLQVSVLPMGLSIQLANGGKLFLYAKPNHTPASFTVLNFPVDDIDAAADELKAAGVSFEKYEGEIETDEKGIHRGGNGGPQIAWFKDPAGNILSVLQDS